ncbi:hypothetical protein [Acinetobacter nosocomialis]|uniref:hypothetical protein n=1 Tax=Acinetobacter nosocomialis TaxID=106654 RepID=UPI000F74A75B|nr:hypothetical protein [Acinetobacter nosocomialis]RSN88689.1 hypothetical protein EA768_00805 [Acinetobacter nosocomialis]
MSEFKKGDLLVPTWGTIKDVMKVVLKPKKKHGITCLTLEDKQGRRVECLAQWWDLASAEEIALGHRIDDCKAKDV